MGFWDWVGKSIVGAFVSAMEWIGGKLLGLYETILNYRKRNEIERRRKQIQDVYNELTYDIDKLLTTNIPLTFQEYSQDAERKAKVLLGSAVTLKTIGDVVGIASELITLGQLESANESIQKLNEMLGITSITPKVIDPLIYYGILLPYEVYIKSRLRTVPLDLGTAREALGRGKIDDSTFINIMRFHGLQEGYFKIFKELAGTPLSPFMIRWVLDSDILDRETIKYLLVDAGYSDKSIEILLKILPQYQISKYRTSLATKLIDLYKDGIIDENDLYSNLKTLGYTDVIVKYLIDRAKYERLKLEISERVKILYNQVINDEITIDDFKNKLKELGIDESRINIFVERLRLVKSKRKDIITIDSIKRSIISKLITGYKDGWIDENRFIKELENLGIPSDTINFLRDRANLERELEDKELNYKMTIEAFRKGLITDTELYQSLLNLGIPEYRAKMIVEYELYRMLPKPKAKKS